MGRDRQGHIDLEQGQARLDRAYVHPGVAPETRHIRPAPIRRYILQAQIFLFHAIIGTICVQPRIFDIDSTSWLKSLPWRLNDLAIVLIQQATGLVLARLLLFFLVVSEGFIADLERLLSGFEQVGRPAIFFFPR
mmetsp:Transcript_30592/g.37741  ORF Transcript_30592/g.37741 Transcript_30592/m.37741 type:complete len:135 (-) Transcript_30592:259-663(-)